MAECSPSLAIFSSAVSQPACFPHDATCISVKDRPGTDRIRLPNGRDKYEEPRRIASQSGAMEIMHLNHQVSSLLP